MKKKTVYISLPVRGQEEYSRKRAEEIENHYRKMGFNVVNPHTVVDELRQIYGRNPTNSEIMSELLLRLGYSDFMALDKNWMNSWGVNYEIPWCTHHDIPIYEAMAPIRLKFNSKITNKVGGRERDESVLEPVKHSEPSIY
ncbi:MAG: DUF4406 domain-containing protein [Bacteroidales bacterium]